MIIIQLINLTSNTFSPFLKIFYKKNSSTDSEVKEFLFLFSKSDVFFAFKSSCEKNFLILIFLFWIVPSYRDHGQLLLNFPNFQNQL